MDVSTLSLSKSYTDNVAAGITAARVEGNAIILTLVDGSEAICQLPTPKDGVSVQNLSIDTDGSLLCHMSDGKVIDAGKVPMIEVELVDYYTKEETNTLLESSGLKTFIWDGLSSEENINNLAFFEEFYADFIASQGKTRLLVTTPNAQNPTYMNAEVGIDKMRTTVYLNISTYPSWWSSVEWDSEEYNFSLSTAYVTIEDGKCVEVSELSDYDAELHFLSTTRQYDSGDFYTPISDGSPISKGYMVETLKEGKYSVSPEKLEEEFQTLITEPIITIDKTDLTEVSFVGYEVEEDGEYGFEYVDEWWGDGYVSTNGAHDNSYSLGKFIINNPGDKVVRVSIDYDLECATTDTAVFSYLDTDLAANSWNDYTNAFKVITGESYTYGSVYYDVAPGEHYITFKYMVGWKDEGEGEDDNLTVSFGYTQGAVQENHLTTREYVDEAVANVVQGSIKTLNTGVKPALSISRVEKMPNSEYEFTLNEDGYYESNNQGIGGSYAHSKFFINNPTNDIVRVALDYIASSEFEYDFGAVSLLDAELVDDGEDFSNNINKVFYTETDAKALVTYDIPSGEHFFTAKYVKDGSAQDGNDSLQLRLGETIGIIVEKKMATEQFVKDYVATNGGGNNKDVDLSNYYTKEEIDKKIGDINSILATIVTPTEEEV